MISSLPNLIFGIILLFPGIVQRYIKGIWKYRVLIFMYCNLTASYMTVWLSFFFLLTFILPGDSLPRSTIVWLRKQQRERSYLTQAQYYVRKHVCNLWLPAYEFILMYSISFFIFVYIVYLWWTPCRRCSASRASSTIKLSFGL